MKFILTILLTILSFSLYSQESIHLKSSKYQTGVIEPDSTITFQDFKNCDIDIFLGRDSIWSSSGMNFKIFNKHGVHQDNLMIDYSVDCVDKNTNDTCHFSILFSKVINSVSIVVIYKEMVVIYKISRQIDDSNILRKSSFSRESFYPRANQLSESF
jgi:hypothetical protein